MTDLRAACIHGRYERHGTESTRTPLPDGGVEISNLCTGGRDITPPEAVLWAVGMTAASLIPTKWRSIQVAIDATDPSESVEAT